MSKNNNSKSKSQSQQNDQENVGYDMWQNLLNNPTPNQHPNQTPNPGFGFGNFAQFPNSFTQQTGWYTNQQIPPCDWSPNTYHGTTSANPQGFQPTPSRFSQNILESSDETEPGSEAEPETQPDPVKKKGKKKKTAPTLRVQVRWTDDEARILAERWIHCSENGIIGNNQTNESFWKKVHSGYNSVVQPQRNLNQLTGKWNKISHDVKTFEGIHRKFRESSHQSGAGDNDVLNAAKKGFHQQVKRKFIYESCWDVLKDYPKFFTEQGVMSNKRPFQAGPEAVDLGENDNPTETTLEANMRTLFRDDLIRRPMGRKASKNSQSSDAGSSSRGSISSERLEALEAVKANALKSTETLEVIKKNNIKKAMFKALSFLSKSLPKRANKKELKLIKLARKEVVEEYQNVYNVNTSDEDENENEATNEDEESSSD